MDKNAIKKFAVWARRELISKVSQKALQYGFSEKGMEDLAAENINGILLSQTQKKQRHALAAKIKAAGGNDLKKGFEQVMEEVAYTWFNRFVALRYMEVNGYLPTRVRVFTNEANHFKPQILDEAIHLEMEGLDMNKVYALKDANQEEELYKYLLVTQCNALNENLPYMFQKINDYTELLLPDYLLREGSVIEHMVSMIPEEDWTDQVQIIGWLYQYYNSELKDETFDLLKKNVKISKERIPAATQLFTPDWIVRYMVENSLGRLWYEGHPGFDKSSWKYYLDEAEQEPEVEEQLKKIRAEYAMIKPEEIKVIDPCMGSGHILVYAFDVLMQIYTSAGWSERDAAKSILENNLYGLDIDDRAGQLAYFAVMMKARKHNRRILNGSVNPNVISIQDSNWMIDGCIDYVAGKDANMKANLILLRKTFRDAKEYGSILNVPKMQYDPIIQRIDTISRSFAEDLFQAQFRTMATEYLLPLIRQSQIMSQKYNVVVTNPPYMGGSGMSAKLAEFVKNNYQDSKSDLFAVFIEKCGRMIKPCGYQAMITQHAWMFLSSFEKLRAKLQTVDTVNMAHLGTRAFEEIGGEVVQTTSFVLRNSHIKYYVGSYRRLIEPTTQQGKENMFLSGENLYTTSQENFVKIPGAPVAYWVSQAVFNTFNHLPIQTVCAQKTRISTGDNDRFMRKWYEIESTKMMYPRKWVPCPKGGDFRKWYGNVDLVLNWENDGEELKAFPNAMLGDKNYFMKPGLTWTVISNTKTGFRVVPKDSICDHKGPLIYIADAKNTYKVLGLLNSRFSEELLKVTSPTIGFEWGAIAKTPWIGATEYDTEINQLVAENISLSKVDWDSFETSWDFLMHPFVRICLEEKENLLEDVFYRWNEECSRRFNQLRANEERLNEIVIDIFDLGQEMKPTVSNEDVTVRKADVRRDVCSFISYAVGCMFGRYSLYSPGIAYAGGPWNKDRYTVFSPDEDSIIPICDDDYFDDDIVDKFVDFIRKVYGNETLEQNLCFVADALGGKGTSREVIRNYFLNGFYNDHLKIYQKRPIYWLFSSGKKNGFKCLIYMHRYQPDTIARIRTDYVHEQQSRYHTAIADIEQRIANASNSDRLKLNKKLKTLQDQSAELLAYEEKIHHLADQMIAIDLDDGVKVNYAKFQDVLAKI